MKPTRRDPELFPDDPNGDTLWELARQGEDLGRVREIDFPVVFPTREKALQYAVQLLEQGQKVSFTPYEEGGELPWQVTAHCSMVPTHLDISEYEEILDSGAGPLGGRTDGWGFYALD